MHAARKKVSTDVDVLRPVKRSFLEANLLYRTSPARNDHDMLRTMPLRSKTLTVCQQWRWTRHHGTGRMRAKLLWCGSVPPQRGAADSAIQNGCPPHTRGHGSVGWWRSTLLPDSGTCRPRSTTISRSKHQHSCGKWLGSLIPRSISKESRQEAAQHAADSGPGKQCLLHLLCRTGKLIR